MTEIGEEDQKAEATTFWPSTCSAAEEDRPPPSLRADDLLALLVGIKRNYVQQCKYKRKRYYKFTNIITSF